jgi:hypothetical protein
MRYFIRNEFDCTQAEYAGFDDGSAIDGGLGNHRKIKHPVKY